MFTKNMTTPVTSAIGGGIQLYMNIALSRARVPILYVNMTNTFSARIIVPINMIVHI